MLKIATDRVRSSLVPIGVFLGLFGRENIHEAAPKRIEIVGALGVPVKRGGVELREQEDPIDVGVDAVTDRDIDQTVLARERNCRFAPLHGQWIETGATPAAHDDRQDIFLHAHIGEGIEN
jgi:hypothetical protein